IDVGGSFPEQGAGGQRGVWDVRDFADGGDVAADDSAANGAGTTDRQGLGQSHRARVVGYYPDVPGLDDWRVAAGFSRGAGPARHDPGALENEQPGGSVDYVGGRAVVPLGTGFRGRLAGAAEL